LREERPLTAGNSDYVPVPALWLKVSFAFAISLVAVYFIPGERSGETPPTDTLLLVAVTIAFVTTIALWLGLRLDLGFPTAVIVYTIGWNVLVVAAKFAFGPEGFYEVNQEVDIDATLPTLDTPEGAVVGALVIFALYAGALYAIYWACRGENGTLGGRLFMGAVFFIAIAGVAAVGAVLFVLPILLAAPALQYMNFVFSSGVSLLVGLSLAGALVLATLSFRSAAERARVLGDAAVLVNLFWVGLAFLAMYQALWVVYVLVLTSIWPLKTVTSK
jgi:hypothetical protein